VRRGGGGGVGSEKGRSGTPERDRFGLSGENVRVHDWWDLSRKIKGSERSDEKDGRCCWGSTLHVQGTGTHKVIGDSGTPLCSFERAGDGHIRIHTGEKKDRLAQNETNPVNLKQGDTSGESCVAVQQA